MFDFQPCDRNLDVSQKISGAMNSARVGEELSFHRLTATSHLQFMDGSIDRTSELREDISIARLSIEGGQYALFLSKRSGMA
jgi:hypothetical protein